MPDRVPRQEPRNDEGRQRRNLSSQQREAVDQISQELAEIRESHETRCDGMSSEISALRETLENQDVQGALDRLTSVEESLAQIPLEGDESILDRLGDTEVALQRLANGGGGGSGSTGHDMRAQAREIWTEEIARNPVWNQLVENDPALSNEYLEALATYISRGKDVIVANQDLRSLAARANAFQTNVLNKPDAIRSAGGVTPEVMASLTTDFDPGFGMAVPMPIATRIIRKAFELSPVLADSGRVSTTSKTYPYLKDTGWDPTVRVRGEREDLIEDDDNDELFEEAEIHVHEESVTTRLSLVMIEDGVDVIQEYEFRTGRGLGKKASWKIHHGSGTKQPLGLSKDTNVIRVMTETADSLPFDAFLNAQLDLDPEYEAGAKYYLSKGATKAAVLAKNAVGSYQWSPSQTDGTPSLLHGYTWSRDPYMSNETAVEDTGVTFATGALPVLFGNVGVSCLNVERLGLQVQIDDVTKKGWRKYWTRRRWGWGIVDYAGLRLVEVGTS